MDLQQQLDEFDQRLGHLEKMLGVRREISEAPPQAATTPPASVSPAKDRSRREELSLLGAGGIFCLVLAALYLVKLAVDAGWLTPIRQIALALSLGLGLIILGLKMKLKDKEYLSYLPAAGTVILYLSILGGCMVHKLYDPMVALLFCGLTSAACIYIYDTLHRFAYLVLSTIGTYLTPFLFLDVIHPELIQSYYLIVTAAYTVIAVILDSRPVALMGAYFALFATSFFGFLKAGEMMSAAIYLGFQAVILMGGTLYHTLSLKRPLSAEQSLMYFPLILFFYGLEYAFLDRLVPEWAPYLAILFAILLLVLYGFLKIKLPKDVKLPSEDLLLSSALVILTHSIYFVLTPDMFQPLFFMVLFALGAYFYHQAHWPENWKLFRKILQVAGAGLLAWNYVLVLFSLIFRDESLWTASGFFLSMGLLGVFKFEHGLKKQGEEIPALLYAPHVLMAASLYSILKGMGSFAVSAAWAVYALAVLGYGYQKKDKTFARSSMVILVLSSVKVFFYDLSGANTGARVASLLVTGALLYTSGWVFRKI